ncbi:MAG: site-specific integrase [Kiritimatiellae bacterium]|nr:site-specific integrase [Kiritimatiellia bacterium]
MQIPMPDPPFRQTEGNVRALLGAIPGKAALFDALNALALLDAARCDTTLSELALAWRRSGRARPDRPRLVLREFFGRYAARFAPEQTCSRALARSLGNLFCRALGPDLPVEALRAGDVAAVLDRYRTPRSRDGMADRIRTALRWGAREGFCDPRLAEAVPRTPVPFEEPSFFLPDRVERIFRAVEAHPGETSCAAGVVLTLGFFAGVRTVEIARASWEDLDLPGAVLRIPRPKGWTSGMRPRLVELEKNAVAWLGHWRRWTSARRRGREPRGPMAPDLRRFAGWKKAWLEPAGDSWGRSDHANVMRHTYATMHVGAFRNAAATALNLGHGRSTDMLEEHYRGLVAKAVAEQYWRIFPKEG